MARRRYRCHCLRKTQQVAACLSECLCVCACGEGEIMYEHCVRPSHTQQLSHFYCLVYDPHVSMRTIILSFQTTQHV